MQENTARAESTEEAKAKASEAAVNRLSSMILRVCHDEAKFDIRLSALVDALGAVIVEYAHNDEGVLIIDDVISIRDRIKEYVDHATTRHTLTRIAKDHTTVGSCCGDDEMKDLANALGAAKHSRHDRRESTRASIHPIPPHVAAALASIFGRGRQEG